MKAILDKWDDLFFVAFSEYGSVKTGFIPSYDQLLDHLKAVKPGGPSSLYDAVYLATNQIAKHKELSHSENKWHRKRCK